MLATSALNLSGHRRRRQIACRPGTSLGVGRSENHLDQIRAVREVVHLFPLKRGDEALSLSSRVRLSVIVKQKVPHRARYLVLH